MAEKEKIYQPEYEEETELPEGINWESVIDAPTSLDELSAEDGARLDTVEQEVDNGFADIAIQDWVFDGAFSASDHDTVAWTSGTLKFKDGTTFAIGAGNTGNMSAITYVYFDKTAPTVLGTTTTAANAIGTNRLQIAVCQNVASGKKAIFQAFGGKGGVGVLLTADNIAANSITANEIQTNTITTLDLTAGTISGMTITGGTVRTSSGSTRVEMSGSNNDLRIYDSGTLRARGYAQGWEYYNGSGSLIGEMYASSNAILIAGDLVSDGKLLYGVGYSGYHAFHVGGIGSTSTLRLSIEDGSMAIGDTDNLGYLVHMYAEMDMYSDMAWNGESGSIYLYDGVVELDSGFVNLAQMTGSTAASRSDERNGSMYYRSDVGDIRVMLGGTWYSLATA